MNYFDHPYPRYGLAAVLHYHEVSLNQGDTLPDKVELAKMAAEYINAAMNKYRLHTDDEPSDEVDTTLTYRYVDAKNLATTKSGGQISANRYYLAPHIATGDTSANRLIKEAKKMSKKLANGKGLNQTTQLKRSFSPFTTKINEGTKSLSNPKTTLFKAGFTLAATITEYKAAAQLDFTNQVMIPDLALPDLLTFIELFVKMTKMENAHLLKRDLKAGKKNYRPPIFEGNYPNAPFSPVFGPLGLIAAMGKWGKRAEHRIETKRVLDKMAGQPIYLVSYDVNLFKQTTISHHAVRLAMEHDLPATLRGLYYSSFYNQEHNRLDSKRRQLFYDMARRFLQLYTHSAFKDFLAFRVEYKISLSPIIKDYFMTQKKLSEEVVQSARAYGSYLNLVAWIIAQEEVKNKDTGRSLEEAKAKVLAQLESTTMSCKASSELFARLNVQAGRMANRDVPAEAAHFIEQVNIGEIDIKTAQNLILAYMRLRYEKEKKESQGAPSDLNPNI